MDDDDPECTGEGRCHGCLKWCSYCGEVDLVCDAPECDSHPRIEAVRKDVEEWRRETRRLERELKSAQKYQAEAEEKLAHYEHGPYRMVSGTRIDLVRKIMES